ncbi:MAG: 4-hydroxybenzoate octaprenyltransferase [Casimicrobiaceae bacterium]
MIGGEVGDKARNPSDAAASTRKPGLLRRIALRLDAYERLIRLDKPIGTLLLLWPTLAALWIAAGGRPTVVQLLVFTMGTLLMRSAGCAMNDWADRRFDPHVKRTAARPLATGEIAPWEALAVAAVLALLAFLLVLATNRTTILLSVPALAIAIAYPFTKRFFSMPQAVLGVAFSFGIPMAFAAVFDDVVPFGWWLLAINFFWVLAYDTEYAMVDRDDDLRLGIRTSAILFGRFDVVAVMTCYAIYLAAMAWVGKLRFFGGFYYAGLAVAAVIALWHGFMIRDRTRAGCFRAFLHNHWLGMAVFAGIVLDFGTRLRAWPRLPSMQW